MPGGGAAFKACKRRRRPPLRQRRHDGRVAAEDTAAATTAPFSTLHASAGAWAALGATHWVLRTILFGLRIPWIARPPPTRSRGYPLPSGELDWCSTEVQRWVAAGFARRLSKSEGAGSLWVSPTFIVHGRKDRLVIDLRLVNEWIQPRLFRYQRLAHFLSALLPDENLVSWDVQDAFYHVRLWPSHRKYFRFVVAGTVYEPRVLPFGMRLSPWAWTKVMRPVVAALRLRGFSVMAYVDDFAATGCGARPSSAASATAGRLSAVALFESLGVHIHPDKGVVRGTTRLPLLGFLVDTRRRLLLLPRDRLAKVVSMAKALLSSANANCRGVSAKLLMRFTGTAVSCALAVPSARFFLRRLYNAQGRRSGTTKLSHGAVRNLRWFSQLRSASGVGRALWESTLGQLTTEASPWGWGGHWDDTLPAAGFFSLADSNRHINVKEVCAVRFCLLAFGSQLLGRRGVLHLRVDSRVAMHVINSFSSRSPALMSELRKLHTVVRSLGVTLRATWLASVANVWADRLSRQRDKDDWRLSRSVYARLAARYGEHTVDRFATALNTHCPRFNSLLHDPGSEAVDAFSVSWAGAENNWIYPPFSQVEQVLSKVRAEGETATVILPVRTGQEWWAPAVAASDEAWLLPLDANLFSSGRSQRSSPLPRWRVAALRFVRGGRPDAAVQASRAKAAAAEGRRRRHRRLVRPRGSGHSAAPWRVPAPAAALTELPPAFCGRGRSLPSPPTRMPARGAPSSSTAGSAAALPSPRPPRRLSSGSAPFGVSARSSRAA